MQKPIPFARRRLPMFVSLVAAWVAATAGARPAAAEVCEGSVVLNSQADVDAFSCTEVTGNLTVLGDGITDLDGLSSLTSVGGGIVIGVNGSLTNVDGLHNLTSAEVIVFVENWSVTGGGGFHEPEISGLRDVDGLSGVTSLGALAFFNEVALTDLDGLSGLTSVREILIIEGSPMLTDFCGLYPLLAGEGLEGGYFVSFNGANPTEQEILDAGPCDPADTIQELFDEGAINFGEAQALLQLADNSLEGLANILGAFVEEGFLTPSEAQLLFVIASIL